jgi:hypothetical protein
MAQFDFNIQGFLARITNAAAGSIPTAVLFPPFNFIKCSAAQIAAPLHHDKFMWDFGDHSLN